jgi:glutamine cyclotransferase
METDDVYLESTGLYGHSKLQRVRLHDNHILKHVNLPSDAFGEGITVHKGKIYQLTWREGLVYIYDQLTLALEQVLELPSVIKEGWGICSDLTHLYISEGSNKLYQLNPVDWTVIRTISVNEGGRAINSLNELEYIDGLIWANIWYEDFIIRINPDDGSVDSYVYLGDLESDTQSNAWRTGNVLNGIAWVGRRLFVTGKRWKQIYEIELRGPRLA